MTADADIRIDRWLWAARLFKTRSAAAVAVRGGRVQVNGQRSKASRPVRLGDRIRISRDRWRMELVVTGLSGRRGPARIAVTLYAETPESIERRELTRHERSAERAAAPAGRPDKKARRELRRLSRGD